MRWCRQEPARDQSRAIDQTRESAMGRKRICGVPDVQDFNLGRSWISWGSERSSPMSSYADRLAALREQLKADRLDGFVVPLTDEHMSEYVGCYAQRLAWLTGFEGSAGSAVVLPRGSGDLRRRPLHAAGPQPGQRRPSGATSRCPKPASPHGSRSMRPRARGSATTRGCTAATGSGRRASRWPTRGAELVAGQAQPDRRGVGRPPRAVEGAAGRPARPICRQERGREAHRHRRLAGQA